MVFPVSWRNYFVLLLGNFVSVLLHKIRICFRFKLIASFCITQHLPWFALHWNILAWLYGFALYRLSTGTALTICVDDRGGSESLTFNVPAENSTTITHKIKRIAMQIDETYLSLLWICIFTAMVSINLLYVGYCPLSLSLFHGSL
jgi:hypothetical protein